MGAVLLLGGCGESFVASGGTGGGDGGSGATGEGGSGGETTGTDGGGGGGTTSGSTTDTGVCKDGDKQGCYDGPTDTKGVGICHGGSSTCAGGQWGPCEGQVTPGEETCNGKDDNCQDGVDEGCSCTNGEKQECYPFPGIPGEGPCTLGLQTCAGGVWGDCVGAVGPSVESCNQTDDDCNGVDDDVEGLGNSCSTGQPGVCDAGTYHCGGGALVCVQEGQPSGEVCDGLDNDCDGIPDNPTGDCTVNLAEGNCTGTPSCEGATLKCNAIPYYFESFGNADGWTLDTEWEIGALMMASVAPGAGNPDPTEDHTPMSNDNKVAGVVIGGNASNTVHEGYYLTSPVIDTQAAPSLYLSYWRWLNTDGAATMLSTVEVTEDGTNWVAVFTNGNTPIFDSAWKPLAHNVSAKASGAFQVRFGVKVKALSLLVSSWNVDDIRLSSCPPMP